MADSQPASPRIELLVLILALIGGGSMVGYHMGLFIPRVLETRAQNGQGQGYSFGDDFYPIWLTARSDTHDLYGDATTRQIQTGLFGRPLNPANPQDPPADYRQFAYPAFTDLVLWPASAISFPALRIVLAIVLPLLTAMSLRLWQRALGWNVSALGFFCISILTLCTYEVLEALFAEQPGLIVGFLLACVAYSLRTRRLMLAGALLALASIKPQMTLLATIYLVLWSASERSRWRFCIGYASAIAALLTSSLLMWPGWILPWIRILLGYHRYAMPPLISVLLGLHFTFANHALIAFALCIGVVLAVRYRKVEADSDRFWMTLAILLGITSIALLPGQAIYDHVILIPAILILLRRHRGLWGAGPAARVLVVATAFVLAWPSVTAFALLCIRPFVQPGSFYSSPLFSLPIRMAAPLPFAVLALLVWNWKISRDSAIA